MENLRKLLLSKNASTANTNQSIVSRLLQTPLESLAKNTTISKGPNPKCGELTDLEKHMECLEKRFLGRSEILLYHALLNVKLRRGINTRDTLIRFRTLWTDYRSLLLSELNSRWLVSACDSIIDYFDEPEERITAMCGSLLVNTIKLYETERLAHGARDKHQTCLELSVQREDRSSLFDGVSAFQIGKGDMIKNMYTRANDIEGYAKISAPILKELMHRVNQSETVYKRLRSVHTNKETLWPA
jgi:hypothetical protein